MSVKRNIEEKLPTPRKKRQSDGKPDLRYMEFGQAPAQAQVCRTSSPGKHDAGVCVQGWVSVRCW